MALTTVMKCSIKVLFTRRYFFYFCFKMAARLIAESDYLQLYSFYKRFISSTLKSLQERETVFDFQYFGSDDTVVSVTVNGEIGGNKNHAAYENPNSVLG